jgi:hypothetical protein
METQTRKKDSYSQCYAPDISFSLLPSCSFQSLERLVLSATSTWTTPNLPALREISIYCEDIGSSSIVIDLMKLPRLSSFELEEYAGEGLALLGPSQTVKKVIFTVSNRMHPSGDCTSWCIHLESLITNEFIELPAAFSCERVQPGASSQLPRCS